MVSRWLQPIPEEKYIRVVFVGKIRIVSKHGKKSEGKETTLEDVIIDYWKRAEVFNRQNFISGHLSCAGNGYVAQLLEGKEEDVLPLYDRIFWDPRVYIWKMFKNEQLLMTHGWGLSMCYSFEITSCQKMIVLDDGISLEDVFAMMKNTHQAIHEKLIIPEFYKETTKTILLKFIYTTGGEMNWRGF